MRIVVGDPRARHAVVTLDGMRQDACTLADEEAGLVVRYARNDAGAFVVDGDAIVEETCFGVVRITLAPVGLLS